MFWGFLEGRGKARFGVISKMHSLQLISFGVVHGGAEHSVTEPQNSWAQKEPLEIVCSKIRDHKNTSYSKVSRQASRKAGFEKSLRMKTPQFNHPDRKNVCFTLFLNCFLHFHLWPSSFVLLLDTTWSISFTHPSGIHTPWKDPSQR